MNAAKYRLGRYVSCKASIALKYHFVSLAQIEFDWFFHFMLLKMRDTASMIQALI